MLRNVRFIRGMSSKPKLWHTYQTKFPNLNVEIVERFTNAYNCIAYSIGVTDRWVWTEVDLNEDGTATYGEFVAFYAKHGLVPTSFKEEATVALYGFRRFNGAIDVKHASRKRGNHWESKMGQGGIIRHRSLDAFDGSPYGDLLLLLKEAR